MMKTLIKNKIFRLYSFLLVLTGIFFICTQAFAQNQSVYSGHTQVTVIPQFHSVKPGESIWVGFLMEMDDEWHTYWRNPGDSGYPTMIEWSLPEGYRSGEILWPYPHRIMMDILTTYGYEGKTFLLTELKIPSQAAPGTTATIGAKLSWLACRVECVPGEGALEFKLLITDSNQPNQQFDDLYKAFKHQYPQENILWKVKGFEDQSTIALRLNPSRETSLKSLAFFPYERGVIDHSNAQPFVQSDDGYSLIVQKSHALNQSRLGGIKGLIVFQENQNELKQSFEISVHTQPLSAMQIQASEATLWWALLFAFIGGLILNLMPCVLPVLSIKVLSLVESAGESRQKALRGAIGFTLGILVSFWFLAFFIVALKAAGHQVGWGFQFQSPIFLIFMSVLFFWLGLNLFGLFEVGTSLTRVENVVSNSFLLKNSFVNGILATVVATPCTAPFMGSAFGYALFKPPVYSYVVFTALGLGLAFPYLILAIFPRFLRFVPKPGAWMLALKKFFGFLFMATVLWLSWVLGTQKGMESIVYLYAGLLIIAVAGWIIGQWATLGHRNHIRWTARIIAIIFFLSGFAVALKGTRIEAQTPLPSAKAGLIDWQNYSQSLISGLRAQQIPFFIDFTAKWCLSCQVNERIALERKDVADKLKEKGVVAIKADWTNYDENITNALAGYGKNSIPLYVLYGSDPNQGPIFLPELLTPKIVLDALDKI